MLVLPSSTSIVMTVIGDYPLPVVLISRSLITMLHIEKRRNYLYRRSRVLQSASAGYRQIGSVSSQNLNFFLE